MKFELFLGIILASLILLPINIGAKTLNEKLPPYNETIINNPEITTYAVYESGNMQAKRYALYIFCVALILLIMSMKVNNHESTESHGKGHT